MNDIKAFLELLRESQANVLDAEFDFAWESLARLREVFNDVEALNTRTLSNFYWSIHVATQPTKKQRHQDALNIYWTR